MGVSSDVVSSQLRLKLPIGYMNMELVGRSDVSNVLLNNSELPAESYRPGLKRSTRNPNAASGLQVQIFVDIQLTRLPGMAVAWRGSRRAEPVDAWRSPMDFTPSHAA
jgi:hypothetical protein